MSDRRKNHMYETWAHDDSILTQSSSSSSSRTSSSTSGSSAGDMRTNGRDAQGYDLEFVPPAEKKYECPICLLVLRDPRQTSCGHRFCKQCIYKWRRDKPTVTCPACNAVLDARELWPDNCAKREILSLTVRCQNEECSTVLELRDLERHLDQCNYAVIPCPNGCSLPFKRQDMARHLEQDCIRRRTKCPYCSAEVLICELQTHTDQCPEINSPCKYCHSEIPRKEHQQHILSTCPDAPVECPFAPFGCTEQLIRGNLEQHSASSLQHHLHLLATQIHKLKLPNHFSHRPDQQPHNATQANLPMQHSFDSHNSTTTSGFYSTSNIVQAGPVASLRNRITGREYPDSSPDFYSPSHGSDYRVFDVQDSMPFSDPMDSRTQLKAYTDRKQRQEEINDMRMVTSLQHEVRDLNQKLSVQTSKLSRAEAMIRELSSVVNDFEGRSCNGFYLWKIRQYSQKRQEAIRGESTAIHSPGFYSGFYGYKLCMRVNLNGVESGAGTHISLFVHFMKGEYDDVVDWPFEGKITISILDQNENVKQRRHIVENLHSKPNLAAFQRPTSNRNHKGFGYLEYAPIAQLEHNQYIKNETLIIKAEIQPVSRMT